MGLLATARALDDQRFLWRVRAATLNLAVTKYGSVNANDKAFAQEILDTPMQQSRTIEALVANNTTVSDAVVVDSNNGVNTEGVTDAQINAAVAMYWGSVAARSAEIRAARPAAPTT